MELTDAVSLAVEECLRADILTDFLPEHKAEVVAMSIYEYNEEYVKRVEHEDGAAYTLTRNVDSLMSNLNVDLSKACEILNTTTEEYERCRLLLADK